MSGSDEVEEARPEAQGPAASRSPGQGGSELTTALEETLSNLSRSIERMESIVRRLEAGDTEWEESVRLLTEANELATNSSQRLEQAVQDVVYGSGDEAGPAGGSK